MGLGWAWKAGWLGTPASMCEPLCCPGMGGWDLPWPAWHAAVPACTGTTPFSSCAANIDQVTRPPPAAPRRPAATPPATWRQCGSWPSTPPSTSPTQTTATPCSWASAAPPSTSTQVGGAGSGSGRGAVRGWLEANALARKLPRLHTSLSLGLQPCLLAASAPVALNHCAPACPRLPLVQPTAVDTSLWVTRCCRWTRSTTRQECW